MLIGLGSLGIGTIFRYSENISDRYEQRRLRNKMAEIQSPRSTTTATHRRSTTSFITKMVDLVNYGLSEMNTGWQYVFGGNYLAQALFHHSHPGIIFYRIRGTFKCIESFFLFKSLFASIYLR